MRAGRRQGRHAGAGQSGLEGALVIAVVALAGAGLVAMMAADAAARGASGVWRWLGPRGRALTVMVTAWPIGEAAGDVKVIPDGQVWTAAAGAAVFAAAAGRLVWLRWAGQREWRESRGRAFGVPVVAEGCERRYTSNAGRLEELERWRLEMEAASAEQAARIAAIFQLMAEAAEAAGLPVPGGEGHPQLRLIRSPQRGA